MRVIQVSSQRSIRSRDSDAASSSTLTTASSGRGHFRRTALLDATADRSASSDKAAWFHARFRDSSSGQRRRTTANTAPLYRDWEDKAENKDENEDDGADRDELDEDEPEAMDIWSPSIKRTPPSTTANYSMASPRRGSGTLPVRRGRGRGRPCGSGLGKRRGAPVQRHADDFWRRPSVGDNEDLDFEFGRSRRKYMRRHEVEGENEREERMVYQPPPAGAYARPKPAQRRLDFGASGGVGSRPSTPSSQLGSINRKQASYFGSNSLYLLDCGTQCRTLSV